MQIHDELMRRATPLQRADALDDVCDTVRQLTALGIRQDRPDASPELVRWLVVERLYDAEVARKLLGQRPDR